MLFFKKKEKESNVMDYLKEADKKLKLAYYYENESIVKGFLTDELYGKVTRDINFRRIHKEPKFEGEKYMNTKYTVIEDSDSETVVQRDIFFKRFKNGGHIMLWGVDFSELITINKTNGFVISAIAAV